MDEAPAAAPITESMTSKRLLAGVIDVVLMVVLFVIMCAIFGDSDTSSSQTSDEGVSVNVELNGAPFLRYLLLVFAYYTALEGLKGATLGKMAAGIRVDGDGTPLTW